MKKLIFIGLSAFLTFALVTCDNVQDENIIVGYTNVEYSDDGKNITIYLDGTEVPVTKASRSLTADLAKKSHDYYEVVFYSLNGGLAANVEVARAAWEIGEAAAITNVYRTALGVNYALTGASVTTGTTPPIGSLLPPLPALITPPLGGTAPTTQETGYAVLFAGRKADKTLLGVGRLTDADGGGVNPATVATTVTTATTKVTFTVASLVAGAPKFDSATNTFPAALTSISRGSSFLTGTPVGDKVAANPAPPPNTYTTSTGTATEGNTVMITRPAIVAGMSYRFPAFGLINKTENLPYATSFPLDDSTRFLTPAGYQIGSNDLATPVPPNLVSGEGYESDRFDDIYKPAIRVVGPTNPAVAENKLPRFPLAGNRYYEFKAPWAIKTTTEMHPDYLAATAAGTLGNELPNPIFFNIETHAENDGFIALVFNVPVFAISNFTPPGVETPITWFIKPGFGTYYYDLDDGTGGPGGSLLIAVGNVNYDSIEIVVKQLP